MGEQEPSIIYNNFKVSASPHSQSLLLLNCIMESIAFRFQWVVSILVVHAAISAAASTIPKRRTVIITGANRGIGLAAAKTLAATNEWNIVMACRSLERAEAAKKTIPNNQCVEVLALDLSDLKSVKKFASEWGSRPLHVLACNAGKFPSFFIRNDVANFPTRPHLTLVFSAVTDCDTSTTS